MGVEFIPCQMTMDMFGLKREDMIDGMGEPAGAATVIGLMTEADSSRCSSRKDRSRHDRHDRPLQPSPAPSTPAAASAPGR